MLTTEALVADIQEDEKKAAGGGGGHAGGGGRHGRRNVLNLTRFAALMRAERARSGGVSENRRSAPFLCADTRRRCCREPYEYAMISEGSRMSLRGSDDEAPDMTNEATICDS